MSVIPILFDRKPCPCPCPCPSTLTMDDFGLGITAQEIQALMEFPRLRVNPHSHPSLTSSDLRHGTIGRDGFQACMYVKQFTPKEITVKTVGHTIVVEGKHEDRQDEHGHISRQFTRKYSLPQEYDTKDVVSSLSSDGVLTIKVPLPKEATKNERVVHFQQTGPAHLNVKENPKEESAQKKK